MQKNENKFVYVRKKQYLCRLILRKCARTRAKKRVTESEKRDKHIACNAAVVGDADDSAR